MPKGVHTGIRGRIAKPGAKKRVRKDRADGAALRKASAKTKADTKAAAATTISPKLVVLPSPTAALPINISDDSTVVLRPPTTMSPAAMVVWAEIAEILPHTGIIYKPSDARALGTLCEDEALLAEAYQAVQDGALDLMDEARRQFEETGRGRILDKPPVAFFLSAGEGKKLSSLITSLSSRVDKLRQQFGLSPTARLRITGGGEAKPQVDELEEALYG